MNIKNILIVKGDRIEVVVHVSFSYNYSFFIL